MSQINFTTDISSRAGRYELTENQIDIHPREAPVSQAWTVSRETGGNRNVVPEEDAMNVMPGRVFKRIGHNTVTQT